MGHMPNQWGKDELFSKWFVISKEPCWKKKKKEKRRESDRSAQMTVAVNSKEGDTVQARGLSGGGGGAGREDGF